MSPHDEKTLHSEGHNAVIAKYLSLYIPIMKAQEHTKAATGIPIRIIQRIK